MARGREREEKTPPPFFFGLLLSNVKNFMPWKREENEVVLKLSYPLPRVTRVYEAERNENKKKQVCVCVHLISKYVRARVRK